MPTYDRCGRSVAGAHQGDVLRVVRDHRFLAAAYLAVDERHSRSIAVTAHEARLRQHGLARGGSWAVGATLRKAVRLAPVGAGRRLRGHPAPWRGGPHPDARAAQPVGRE